MKHWKAVVVLGGYLVFTMSLLYSQRRPQSVDWPVYGGTPGSMRYSSLKQINQGFRGERGDRQGNLEVRLGHRRQR
jgi:hypothetical protein